MGTDGGEDQSFHSGLMMGPPAERE
jgi:hypothetical protein